MAHYYHLDSSGEETNLQLYSLRQAKKYWKELNTDYMEFGEDTVLLKERLVFILSSIGLSISQLLGQNDPILTDANRYPIQIFNAFVDEHELDQELKTKFEKFNYFYNGCRHFRKTISGSEYTKIDQITFEVAKDCFSFGLEVWKTVIGVYRNEQDSDLEEFDLNNIDEDYEE